MALAGFARPDGGSIRLADTRNDCNAAAQSAAWAWCFQSYALFPFMTVAENVAYPLKVRGVSKSDQIDPRRTRAGYRAAWWLWR